MMENLQLKRTTSILFHAVLDEVWVLWLQVDEIVVKVVIVGLFRVEIVFLGTIKSWEAHKQGIKIEKQIKKTTIDCFMIFSRLAVFKNKTLKK